jgi:hypothetical protein
MAIPLSLASCLLPLVSVSLFLVPLYSARVGETRGGHPHRCRHRCAYAVESHPESFLPWPGDNGPPPARHFRAVILHFAILHVPQQRRQSCGQHRFLDGERNPGDKCRYRFSVCLARLVLSCLVLSALCEPEFRFRSGRHSTVWHAVQISWLHFL